MDDLQAAVNDLDGDDDARGKRIRDASRRERAAAGSTPRRKRKE